MDIFTEIGLILALATGVSIGMKILKQPYIAGYILTGILVGPFAFNILHSTESFEGLSKIGIAILLFVIGLHLNPSVIKEIGKAALLTGVAQITITSAVGYWIAHLLGFSLIPALYIAVALTLSSTIIILKLLSDKGDLQSLYGKVTIGFLIVQDLFASAALIGIATFAQSQGSPLGVVVLGMISKLMIVVPILVFVNKVVITRIENFFAQSQELLFLTSLTWGIGMAGLFHILGFSAEIGALAAGVTIATSPFATEIGARMKPLRDFFIVIFFLHMGAQITIESFSVIVGPALVLSTLVLVGDPLIMYFVMNLLGFRTRTAFLSATTVAQVSEFSLILAALGVSVGHISPEVLSLITLVTLITITISSYVIHYADFLYGKLKPLLVFLEFRKVHIPEANEAVKSPEIILYGYDRVGANFVKAIKALRRPFLVVDYNPQTIKRLEKSGVPCLYGDAEDIEFIEEIGHTTAKLFISTIPDFEVNKLLVRRAHSSSGIKLVIAQNARQAKELYALGATYVIMPHYLGAKFAAHMVTKYGIYAPSFGKERRKHKKELSRTKSH